jgi:ADP-ribose pyrophosphatase YjhB (NUDIX family)
MQETRMTEETDERAAFRLVVHVLLERNGRLLLLRRRGTGIADGAWAPPGGHVEAGETPREAALRELAEETGLAVPGEELVPAAALFFDDGVLRGMNLVFRAAAPAGAAARLAAAGADRLAFHAPGALPRPCVPWLREVLARPPDPSPGAWYGEWR